MRGEYCSRCGFVIIVLVSGALRQRIANSLEPRRSNRFSSVGYVPYAHEHMVSTVAAGLEAGGQKVHGTAAGSGR